MSTNLSHCCSQFRHSLQGFSWSGLYLPTAWPTSAHVPLVLLTLPFGLLQRPFSHHRAFVHAVLLPEILFAPCSPTHTPLTVPLDLAHSALPCGFQLQCHLILETFPASPPPGRVLQPKDLITPCIFPWQALSTTAML